MFTVRLTLTVRFPPFLSPLMSLVTIRDGAFGFVAALAGFFAAVGAILKQ